MFSLHVDTARTWRGGQNQVLLTVMGLREAGLRAELVAHPDGELRRRAAEGLDLIALVPRHEADFAAGWRFSRILRTERPDIVHAHDPHGVTMASIGISMSRLDPAPRLVAARRVDFPLKMHAFSRWKYKQVDLFICASEAIRHILLTQGVEPSRAITVHEGVDLVHVDAAPRGDLHAEFWLPHQAPLVGNIGALVPHKGQRDFVDAAARVLRHVPDTRFVIAGEGELRPQLEQQIRHLSLEKHVLLAGFRTDVLSLLKAFDVFVMSSVTEGLGTSVIDAMACRRPVVGTRAGGIPELVVEGETGHLVPVGDAAGMAEAIVSLLRDERRRARYGAAGRARVEARFTVPRMVRATIDAYESLAGRPRAADSRDPRAGR
ncbi:MAG: glycosyltransferase [Vicinamibacterales bacterium]|nr:glycosyltransferase [Vicinamibacterales bacterium]